jgi:succinyl-CoA synthetase beta subunit
MDIEEVAKDYPSALGKYVIHPSRGLPSFAVMDLARGLGFPHRLWGALIDIAGKLYKAFCQEEATLAELNPLAETTGDSLIAVDSRLSVDDNALFRHPELNELKKGFKEMSLKDKGLDYIDLRTGEVGLLCVGAGMTMLTMDLVAQAGAKARCFLDVSHGISAEGLSTALELLASEPGIKCVLVNMFGGLSRMDEIATFMLQAIEAMGGRFPKPILIRLQGTNAEIGRRMMMEAGYVVSTELEELMDNFKELLKGTK